MPYPVTADGSLLPGLSPEGISRRWLRIRCLADYFGELAEGEPPPTESDLEEMQAEEEGWGHQWRAEREEERFQQAEHEARERQQARKTSSSYKRPAGTAVAVSRKRKGKAEKGNSRS